MDTDHQRPEADDSGCRGCSVQDCRAADREDDLPPSGWRLGLSSTGLFLGPGVLAIVASLCYADSRVGQLLAATAGLVIGMTASVVLAKLLHRLHKAESTKKSA